MTRYLFIDGAYLAEVYKKLMQAFWNIDGEINFMALKGVGSANKVFYYDCVDDVVRPNETREQLDARVQAKEDFLNRIRELTGFHVQEGRIAGVRRRQQKQVDVQLTVDMLMHAVHRNMTHATLLAGDRDFLPLIEALEGLGTHVTVMYERTSGARALHWAADAGVGITIREAYNWTSAELKLKDRLTIPHEIGGVPAPSGGLVMRSGTVMGRSLVLFGPQGDTANFVAWVAPSHTEHSLTITFADAEKLTRYIENCYGEITWKT